MHRAAHVPRLALAALVAVALAVVAVVASVAPELHPLAGLVGRTIAIQLTGIPAELSTQSLLSRLVLGVQFDRTDLLWYPAGIVPLVVLHWLLRKRVAQSHERTGHP